MHPTWPYVGGSWSHRLEIFKLIAQTISQTPLRFVAYRPSTYSQGNMGKFGETRGGVRKSGTLEYKSGNIETKLVRQKSKVVSVGAVCMQVGSRSSEAGGAGRGIGASVAAEWTGCRGSATTACKLTQCCLCIGVVWNLVVLTYLLRLHKIWTYTMMPTAMNTWKTNSILWRNRQIHDIIGQVMFLVVMVCGRRGLWPSLSNPQTITII